MDTNYFVLQGSGIKLVIDIDAAPFFYLLLLNSSYITTSLYFSSGPSIQLKHMWYIFW